MEQNTIANGDREAVPVFTMETPGTSWGRTDDPFLLSEDEAETEFMDDYDKGRYYGYKAGYEDGCDDGCKYTSSKARDSLNFLADRSNDAIHHAYQGGQKEGRKEGFKQGMIVGGSAVGIAGIAFILREKKIKDSLIRFVEETALLLSESEGQDATVVSRIVIDKLTEMPVRSFKNPFGISRKESEHLILLLTSIIEDAARCN